MSLDIELAVFDITGTIVEDRGEIEDAFAKALASSGLELDDETFASVRGMSKREAVAEMLSGASDRVESVYRRFLSELTARYESTGARFLPGVRETFAWLGEQRIPIALNTGLDRSAVKILLEKLPPLDGIAAIVCGDEVSRGRPAPYLIFRAMERTGVESVHRVLTVGDTVRDLEAGANGGVRYNVGVLTGAHDRARLEKAPHSNILPAVSDLRSLWG